MKELDKTTTEDQMTVNNDSSEETMPTSDTSISRRGFIRWGATGLGVAAALPLFGGTAEAARAVTSGEVDAKNRPTEGPDAEAAARERQEVIQAAADEAFAVLVAPIAVGTQLGTVKVESLRVDKRGVGIVEMRDARGRNYLAEVCRRTQQDVNVRPLAVTKNYSLYLYNNGSGSVPTDENVGRAVAVVGNKVRANEKKVEVLALRSRKELWQAEGYLG